MYSTSVMFKQHLFMVLGAPIRLDSGRIIGVILTCRRILQMDQTEKWKNQESYVKGYIAKRDFNCIIRKSPSMCQCIEQAKIYALSEKPILICGNVFIITAIPEAVPISMSTAVQYLPGNR